MAPPTKEFIAAIGVAKRRVDELVNKYTTKENEMTSKSAQNLCEELRCLHPLAKVSTIWNKTSPELKKTIVKYCQQHKKLEVVNKQLFDSQTNQAFAGFATDLDKFMDSDTKDEAEVDPWIALHQPWKDLYVEVCDFLIDEKVPQKLADLKVILATKVAPEPLS